LRRVGIKLRTRLRENLDRNRLSGWRIVIAAQPPSAAKPIMAPPRSGAADKRIIESPPRHRTVPLKK